MTYNNNSLVEDYGYLYWGNKAPAACPPGWRLPTSDECNTLVQKVDFYIAGGSLKESGDAH